MNTRHDDPQFHKDCHWYNGEAHPDDVRRPKDIRWLVYYIIGLCAIAMLLLWVGPAKAGGTVTDSTYVLLQRSGATLAEKPQLNADGSVKVPALACPLPKTMLECVACMLEMVDAERKSRTSGYVTYRCLDAAQKYVKFSKTPAPPVVTPATTQVLTCPETGADGRILESDTINWPNCPGAVFANPSKSLVVAVNTGNQPMYWRLASKVTDGRVWAKANGVETWTPVEDINWGTTPPVVALNAPLTWKLPTKNTDGTPLTNLSGYRIYYGTSPTALIATVEISNPLTLAYTVPNLTAGTWHFGIKSLTPAQESDMSNTVSVTLP